MAEQVIVSNKGEALVTYVGESKSGRPVYFFKGLGYQLGLKTVKLAKSKTGKLKFNLVDHYTAKAFEIAGEFTEARKLLGSVEAVPVANFVLPKSGNLFSVKGKQVVLVKAVAEALDLPPTLPLEGVESVDQVKDYLIGRLNSSLVSLGSLNRFFKAAPALK